MKRTPPPRKALDGLRAYSEESTAPLNLSNNTNLFEPNPAFAEALASFEPERAREYPSLDSARFREAAARTHGLHAEQVVTGNGSNDLIDLALRAFAEPGEAMAWHPPSFEMIGVFGRVAGLAVREARLREPGFALDAQALLDARAKVTIICRPNNPTGNAFPRSEVQRVIRESDGLVIVDEAYEDFLGDSLAPVIRDQPNLLLLRTLSKAHGLAGLRIGYGLAQEPVIQALAKARGPFRLNAISEHVGIKAVERNDYVRRVVDETKRERALLEVELRTRGIRVQPSDANFLLFKPQVDAGKLHDALLARGIAVRKFSSPILQGWIRATVGPAWITRRFLADLDASLRDLGARP